MEKNKEVAYASVISYKIGASYITIPGCININSDIFKVTSIAECSFSFAGVKSLNISEFSEIRSIEKDAFFESSIEYIELPSNISDLKEDWNNGFYNLKEIKIIENSEQNIKIIDEKFLVGKSDTKSDTFDTLLLVLKGIEDVTIPSYIKHIGPNAFQNLELASFKIQENSELQTIGKNAFSNLSVQYIELPSSMIKFEKYWCDGIFNNIRFKIIKNGEENIKIIDEKILVGKSDRKSDTFDILYFAFRDIEEVTIPSYIKRIDSFAFGYCKRLKTVNFFDDSELESICEYAFTCSSIEFLIIPSHVKKISANAFNSCNKIKSIKFQENSELQKIENEAFNKSSIERLEIPSTVKELKDNWCSQTCNLRELQVIKNGDENIKIIDNKFLVGKSDLKSDEFDVILFAPRDIEDATIPANIKRIGSNAFCNCQIKSIKFESNSNLQKISEKAFYQSSIKSISIPSSVIEIGQYAFACENLSLIEFPNDSKLKILSTGAFSCTSIEEISIPSHVTEIPANLFKLNKKILKVKFHKNSELRSFEAGSFLLSNIESIEIPSSVVEFKKSWCFGCRCIKEIKVIKKGPENIKFFDKSKFLVGKTDLKSDIFDVIYLALNAKKEVIIPKQIKRISDYSFCGCDKLRVISFQENSELQSIGTRAFLISFISSISLPPNLTEVETYAFTGCQKIRIIEFLSKKSFDLIQNNLLFDMKFDTILMVQCSYNDVDLVP